jgi:predicted transcriptional regulator YdeE
MYLIYVEEKNIYGIKTRTKNCDEMEYETSKIAPLWKKFYQDIRIDYQNGDQIYSVYYSYESDFNGEFNVMAGSDHFHPSLEIVKIEKGNYVVFEGEGQMPQVVIETWGKVWEYFANINSQYRRAYTTDFEHYVDQHKIKIYIAVK